MARVRKTSKPILKTLQNMTRTSVGRTDTTLWAHIANVYDGRGDGMRALEWRAIAQARPLRYAAVHAPTGYRLCEPRANLQGLKIWITKRCRGSGATLRLYQSWVNQLNGFHQAFTIPVLPLIVGYYHVPRAEVRIDCAVVEYKPYYFGADARVSSVQTPYPNDYRVSTWPGADLFSSLEKTHVDEETAEAGGDSPDAAPGDGAGGDGPEPAVADGERL